MNLLNGIAVIVDDGINSKTPDKITEIIKKIQEKGIPTVLIDNLAAAHNFVPNFLSVNFFIVDWSMPGQPTNTPEEVGMGEAGAKANYQSVIDFVQAIKKSCFAPIFIFTNESESDIGTEIISKLKQADLYFDDDSKNFIHPRNKTEILKDDNLFKDIDKWLNKTPSIYLLKTWEKKLLSAKNEIFWELYDKSKGNWPRILWNQSKKEKEEPSKFMHNTVSQLINNQIDLNEIEENKIIAGGGEPTLEEIKNIITKTMHQETHLCGIKPGDLFKKDSKYYLNIRPECDTVPRREGESEDEIELYLIKGRKISADTLKKIYDEEYKVDTGFTPKVTNAFVFLLEGNDIIKFSFKKLSILKFSEMKTYRICRLLSPYITRIQQRFASFIGRVGDIRLPEEVERNFFASLANTQNQSPTVSAEPEIHTIE